MLGPAEEPHRRFSFAVSRALSTAVVTLHGDLDQPSVEGLTATLRNLFDDHRNRTVVVDMRDVSDVDPSALTLFRDALGGARRRGIAFYLHAPPPAAADRFNAERSMRDIILV